jgi:hypothetical protein
MDHDRGVIFIVPYLQLQLTGLGIIVEVASFQAISRRLVLLIAFIIVTGFVFASGIRDVAWVCVLKDVLVNRADVPRIDSGASCPSDHAGQHRQYGACLVYLDDSAHRAWRLHVAARIWFVYRKEWRYGCAAMPLSCRCTR